MTGENMKQLLSVLLGLLIISSAGFAAGTYLDPTSGDSGLMNTVGCSYEYQCIDDGSSASSSDYIYHADLSEGNISALYDLENLPPDATSINYIRVYYYAATNQIWVPDGGGYTLIKKRRITPAFYDSYASSVDHSNPVFTPLFDYSWNHYSSRTYYSNPRTGFSWTVPDINNLRTGINLAQDDDGPRIGRIRVYVNYNTG